MFEKIKNNFLQELPFVAYRKPNETNVKGLFQEDDSLHTTSDYSQKGFVFAPFDDSNPAILIPFESAQYILESVEISADFSDDITTVTDANDKAKHIDLVEKGIEAIVEGQFQKVVLSRQEHVSLSEFDAISLFKRLLSKYPTAFVYVWFHPKVGLWLGATPETLVKLKGSQFETMSLAGTQSYTGNLDVLWEDKEIEEQQIVTDYIESELKTICTDVVVHPRKTIQAGNLVHLQTKITGESSSVKALIKTLHPTPAVCGMPKDASKTFILQNEGYQRAFYTGFLGELHIDDNHTNLFVNLRCMQIQNETAIVYVGGGVTKDSSAPKEWEETKAKSKVMKSVL